MAVSSKFNTRLEFEGFEEVIARLTKLNGNVKDVANKALKESHKIVTKKAEDALGKSPNEKWYETGETLDKLERQAIIEWAGTLGSVDIGFRIDDDVPVHIFMMYGTPRYMKNQKLRDAFWSKKTRDEVRNAQEDIFYSEIRRLT